MQKKAEEKKTKEKKTEEKKSEKKNKGIVGKNVLFRMDGLILRVLEIKESQIFVIDCCARTIPKWISAAELDSGCEITETELLETTKILLPDFETLDAKSKCIVNERFTLISGILPYVSDFQKRNQVMEQVAQANQISRQTVRNYLCLYLAYQDKAVLAPKPCVSESTLTPDEKNMRWALNKYFYNSAKNSLRTAYTLMLKSKYCDSCNVLLPEYPSFYQFQYFYRRTKKLQNYLISRNGLTYYQRNNRPLLGDKVQDFAPAVGTAMLDSTVCDIYLVNESGTLVGRPILTACVDAYSGLCCGYSLGWQGGTYSLRSLMQNVIADKVNYCAEHGIQIENEEWNCKQLPAVLVTDKGAEYKSEHFEQLAELGVTIINLPSYRPELKGVVEKFFDVVQGLFKPYLRGKGTIETDFQERGARDYRKDACLTLEQFEKVLLHCIVFYNSKRVLENYPYTEDMLEKNIQPYASEVWNYGLTQDGANLISVSSQDLTKVLLPRVKGKFSRFGLKVNGLRYKHDNFTERYLTGGEAMVAYNPDDVSCVWLIEKGKYIQFELIDSRFCNEDLTGVLTMKNRQKQLVQMQQEFISKNYYSNLSMGLSDAVRYVRIMSVRLEQA